MLPMICSRLSTPPPQFNSYCYDGRLRWRGEDRQEAKLYARNPADPAIRHVKRHDVFRSPSLPVTVCFRTRLHEPHSSSSDSTVNSVGTWLAPRLAGHVGRAHQTRYCTPALSEPQSSGRRSSSSSCSSCHPITLHHLAPFRSSFELYPHLPRRCPSTSRRI